MSSVKLTTQVYSAQGDKVKEVELNPAVFGVALTEELVHQAFVAQIANSRQVLAHTKQRGDVSGGGRKPWRQKGTGRARHGSSRSPIWVGGGVTFGPTKDRNFSQKINKKMKKKALFMCLSDKVKNDFLVVLDKLDLTSGKTKDFVAVLSNLNSVLSFKLKPKKVKKESVQESQNTASIKTDKKSKSFDIKAYKPSLLVVLAGSDRKVFQSVRNLSGVKIVTANTLNVVDLLRYQKVLLLEESLIAIEKNFLAVSKKVAVKPSFKKNNKTSKN